MPNTKAEGKVLQYLYEAHSSELALVQTLTAHIAMTPAGPYRSGLERHRLETRDHASRVRNRIRDIERGRSLVQLALDVAQLGVGVVQGIVGQVLAAAKTPLDLLRGGLRGEEKLLKNAKDECATEALEIATYQAIEQLAASVGDQETARMAASIRADEERFLNQLRQQIPALTEAVLAAELGGRGTYAVSKTGAAQAVRGRARAASRHTRRAGKAVEETAREATEAAAAVRREAAAGAEATGREAKRGARRTARELTGDKGRGRGGTRERASRTRANGTRAASARDTTRGGAAGRSASARGAAGLEPWPGYDEQPVAEIADRLEQASASTAQQVREYESQHKDRAGVIESAEKEVRRQDAQAKEEPREDGTDGQ
ncbi:MAG TPA: hypothetical protein VFN71_03475 [Methylomirabilota bacterium]|nr:hypothetical protein [Methylomirabilota bacterium]